MTFPSFTFCNIRHFISFLLFWFWVFFSLFGLFGVFFTSLYSWWSFKFHGIIFKRTNLNYFLHDFIFLQTMFVLLYPTTQAIIDFITFFFFSSSFFHFFLHNNMSIHQVYIHTLYIYIIIIMSCGQHGYPWPSLSTSPYHSSPLAGLQGYIPYHHIAAVCMFKLVVLLLIGHM